MKRKLKIAVRELVAHVLRTGDLVLGFAGSTRPVEAIRAHQKIQNSRPPNYTPEVTVSRRIETDQFVLTVNGRIDGVYSEPGAVTVEEIKTTRRDLEHLAQEDDPVHWGQLKCYACLLASGQRLDEIAAQLVYLQTETGQMRTIKRHFAVAELELFFQNLVAHYLRWATAIVDWCQLRDASIRQLPFPFVTYRPGQRKMAVDVFRTIRNDSQLLIQAATGIGKTMAVIFAAVKAIGEGLTSKIFYLTARTTGAVAAQTALDEMRKTGLKLKSLNLTAKDKICFNPGAGCNPEECEFARGHYDRVDDALQEIFRQDAFTRPVVTRIAADFRICPFEFSLDLARWTDCLICDYNYAFDPRVFLRRFFQDENGDYTFLIDEAHNLVDRSREMFSAELFKQSILDVRRAVKNDLPQVRKVLGKINTWMVGARKKCETQTSARHEKQAPAALLPLLHNFIRISEYWLSRNRTAPWREQLLGLYFAACAFVRVAEHYDETYVSCYEKIKKDLKLRLFCLDPSRQLKNALNRCQAAIFFSATMTPAPYFKKILGCDESTARHLALPSPFPGENFGLFIADKISTLFRQRSKTREQVVAAIRAFTHQKKGNYLIFLPSYDYMMMVQESFQAACPECKIIFQTPGMSESARETFLAQFGRENSEALVGFAVMGGIFGEGIDLAGNRLVGAVVVGVGLPGLSMERELIRDYFEDTLRAGFEYAYQYPGINRVLQAAGRVIRSETDRGAVLLIDQRYGTHRYRCLLPETWRPVRVSDERQLAENLQEFWNPEN